MAIFKENDVRTSYFEIMTPQFFSVRNSSVKEKKISVKLVVACFILQAYIYPDDSPLFTLSPLLHKLSPTHCSILLSWEKEKKINE